jgi:hypothetical protein
MRKQLKTYNQLTELQKIKIDIAINKTVDRINSVIEFYEYQNNEIKKQVVINDSIDIYYYSVSNIIDSFNFHSHVRAKLNF